MAIRSRFDEYQIYECNCSMDVAVEMAREYRPVG
jgi:hypothetical protein